MKAALITGCAGFIGSHLAHSLLADGWRVYGIDDLSTGLEDRLLVLRHKYGDRFSWERSTVQGSNMLPTYAQANVVFHLAARGSVPFSIENADVTHEANVGGFFELLDFIRYMDKRPRIVFASSSSVYGDDPSIRKVEDSVGAALSPYAATKQVKEIYGQTFARCYGLEIVALRYFNVFGPGQRADSAYSAVIPKWTRAMLRNEPVYINGKGHRMRDFTPVQEVVRATRMAGEVTMYPGQFHALNVGCGHMTSLTTLFDVLSELTGYRLAPEYAPSRDSDIACIYADTTKAERVLGFRAPMKPERFIEHLKDVVDSMREGT